MQDEATYRAIVLAKNVNVPLYVVHVMSGGAAGHIGSARAKGQRVIGEAVASGIAASEASAFDPDFKVISQPEIPLGPALMKIRASSCQQTNSISLRRSWKSLMS